MKIKRERKMMDAEEFVTVTGRIRCVRLLEDDPADLRREFGEMAYAAALRKMGPPEQPKKERRLWPFGR